MLKRYWMSDINLHIYSQENQQNFCRQELHFFTPVCTKSFVGWGFTPDPTGGAYNAPPNPLAMFKGPYF